MTPEPAASTVKPGNQLQPHLAVDTYIGTSNNVIDHGVAASDDQLLWRIERRVEVKQSGEQWFFSHRVAPSVIS